MQVSKQREKEVFRGNARIGSGAAPRSLLFRLLTDRAFVSRVMRYALGLPVPMETEDRRVLEQVIFPYFLCLCDIRTVLFVGCDWYTKHYESVFFRTRTYWTIDPAPRVRKFAGKRHVSAPLEELDRNFAPEHFDLIICNGVYGFGLDGRAQCERAFELCHSRLRADGYFVLGWDDIPARTPVPLADIASLRLFRPFELPALGTWRYVTDTPYHHTYDFYRK